MPSGNWFTWRRAAAPATTAPHQIWVGDITYIETQEGWLYLAGILAESAQNLLYQRLLDEEDTRHPFYGVRKMTVWLQLQNHAVGPKRVRHLLRTMGLMAVYPKPRLSLNPSAHQRFPYLLKGLASVRPNQVWGPTRQALVLRSATRSPTSTMT